MLSLTTRAKIDVWFRSVGAAGLRCGSAGDILQNARVASDKQALVAQHRTMFRGGT
jgi:hypothetical protein